MHRYTFAGAGPAQFILDLEHASGEHPKILSSQLEVIGSDTASGGRQTAIWAQGRHIYFVMQFSRPFQSTKRLSDRKLLLHFDLSAGESIQVKTGISGTGVEGARKNLNAEIPGWDFDQVRRMARASWEKELSRVQIETRNEAHKQIFYTRSIMPSSRRLCSTT